MEEVDKGGPCAICGEDSMLVIDHDHVTTQVRGRLCTRCNHGIAWFNDDPARLEAAAAYLRHPPGVQGMSHYPYMVVYPEHLQQRRPRHAGTISLRGDGRWEARIMFEYRRISFYGKSHEDVEAKLDAFKRQHGITSTTTA